MNWIPTYTGKAFYPLEPQVEDVCIEDIAHHLALKARWTGATRDHCNVAHHSVLVAQDVERTLLAVKGVVEPKKAECVIAALLHDASEAYLPDMARNLKDSVYFLTRFGVERFRVVEDRLLGVIFDALGLARFGHCKHYIKESDVRAMISERVEQVSVTPLPWIVQGEPLPGVDRYTPLGQKESEHLFLQTFRRLYHATNR